MTTANRRLTSIQLMRGVAALLVVLAHAVDMVESTSITAVSPSRFASLGDVGDFGAIGVDLFFIISGFVMAFSVRHMAGGKYSRAFLALRWVRIAPPLLITSALYLLHNLATGQAMPTWRGAFNTIMFVPLLDGDGYSEPLLPIAWTLSFEFTFYLAVAAMVLLGLAQRLEILAAALVALGFIGAVWDPSPYIFDWVTNPILIEFALGIFAYKIWASGMADCRRPLWIAAAIGGAAVLLVQVSVGVSGRVTEAGHLLNSDGSLERVALWGLPMLLIFLALLPTAQGAAVPRLKHVGRMLGDASYSIYLTHLLTLIVVREALERSPVDLNGDLMLLASVGVSVCGGVAYYLVVERPVTERLRSALARRLKTQPHLAPPSQDGVSAR